MTNKVNFRVLVNDVWVNLPMTCNEIEKMGVSIDTYITDAEVNLPFKYEIGEYTIGYLNSLAATLAEINSKGDLEWLAAYIEATGYSLEFALDNYKNHSYYDAEKGVIDVY